MDSVKRETPEAGQASGGAFDKVQSDYNTTPHPYLELKGIDLADLQAACKCKVEIRPTTLGNFRGLAVFRELLAVDGSAKGFERILSERISFDADSKPNDKFTQKGSTVSGTFTPIGFHPSELMSMDCRIIVCAGLADGYRLHEATGEPVACGSGEGNIRSIVEAIQPLNPSILVAVDNDEAGKRAGNDSGCKWIHPNSHKDWSDVYQAAGLESVLEQLAVEAPPEDDPYGLQAAKVGDLLDTDPPAREWLVTDRLPRGVVGVLAAAGGTGKSMATLQLAISVCTGLPWLEMPIDKTGAVLMFSAEDDRDEIHRRLRAVLGVYSDNVDPFNTDAFKAHKAAIAQRLHVFDRVGKDNRLTAKLNGEIQRTAFVRWVVEAAQKVPDVALIVLDPLARFDGGDPNDNADSTRLIECAEQIRKATGATILLPHHVNKGSLKDPGSGQEAVRGGSGLVDGARWVGLLAGLRADQAKKEYGIDPEQAGQYVRFTTPKANYSAPWEGTWLRRLAGGALVPCELKAMKDTRQEQRAADRYAAFLVKAKEMIGKAVQKSEPLTARKLRGYAGTAGVFGMGEQMLRGCVNRAIEEGAIIKGFDGTLRLG
jgi:RecA-family ATPase